MLFPTLLAVCFVVGVVGVVLARTDGSALYLAFCVLSPVLLPIWIGMQVGEWLTSSGKKLAQAPRTEPARMNARVAFARPMQSRAA